MSLPSFSRRVRNLLISFLRSATQISATCGLANLRRVWMSIGVPSSSANCFDGVDFFVFALGAKAMRVPRPAAGIMTTTFMEGD